MVQSNDKQGHVQRLNAYLAGISMGHRPALLVTRAAGGEAGSAATFHLVDIETLELVAVDLVEEAVGDGE